MKRQELRELMNCCRPDLSDLTEEEARALVAALEQDPVLRREWQAIQSWDVAIGRAFHDVPVPDGLADRLVAAVVARRNLPGEDAVSVPPADAGSAPQLARETRRHWLVWPTGLAAGLLVTSAIVMLALWLSRLGRQPDGRTKWLRNPARGLSKLDPEAWQPTDPPDAEFPLDPSVRLTLWSWQPCTAHRRAGRPWYTAPFCHRTLRPPSLFVIRTRQGRQLPTIPPTVPDSTTGNICIGVWKNNGCVYVLVVPGRPSDYLRTLRTQSVA